MTKTATAKKTTKAKSAKPNGKTSERASEAERAKAAACGLTLVQHRILTAISKSTDGLSYRGIEAKTGYYSILTSQLRAGASRPGFDPSTHDDSLGSKGLVREEMRETEDSRSVLTFVISAKGRKTLEKGKK